MTIQTQLSLLLQEGTRLRKENVAQVKYFHIGTNTDSRLTHAQTAGEMTQADYNCLNDSEIHVSLIYFYFTSANSRKKKKQLLLLVPLEKQKKQQPGCVLSDS